MNIGTLIVSVIVLNLACTTWADDLPRLGYEPGIPVKDLAAKGYRWVTVNGPYACTTEPAVQRITSHRTDATELEMVEDGEAYYLIPGTLVRIIRHDDTKSMAEILLGGLIKPVWTYTKFLTARPIHDIYGIVETPDTAGLVDPSDAPGHELRSEGPTPAQTDGNHSAQCTAGNRSQMRVNISPPGKRSFFPEGLNGYTR